MSTGPIDPSTIALPARYRVQRPVGVGGMATVHLAEDAESGAQVAIKLLKRDLAGSVMIERFLQEIRFTHELSHPNIIPLLDSGEADGLPFLVMPFIPGETLQTRLRKERQLPLAEAVRIALAVAQALEAAHRHGAIHGAGHGIIHRDVKPANILLDGEAVYLTDFGIARAIDRSATDQITVSGMGIGTSGYMSPEQALGERNLDARSDLYALACVTYEMLAGEPPFTGPTAREVIAKQVSLPAPSVRVIRPTLPEAVDEVLRRALEKTPADRYATVREFAEALEEGAKQPGGQSTRSIEMAASGMRAAEAARRARRTRLVLGGVAVAVVALGTGEAMARWGSGLPDLAPADSARYAVFPLAGAASLELARATARGVRGALQKWTDVTVIDEALVDETLAAIGVTTPTPTQAARASRELGAGRYVRGEIHGSGVTTEVRLRLVDAIRGDSVLGEVSGILGAGPGESANDLGRLVDALILGRAPPGDHGSGTASLAARRAYANGEAALRRFSLHAAESAFVTATQLDDRYASAHLGLALARLWRGDETARWRINAEQAVLGAPKLSPTERRIAAAVAASARDTVAPPCDAWRDLAARDSLEVLTLLGAAQCLADDELVLPDPRSPSRWRFRSSYREALADYRRAFELEPRILEAFGGESMERLQRLFHTAGNQLRQGRATVPSPMRFSANMAWIGDTLAFVPYPKPPNTSHIVRDMPAWDEARRRQRELVRNVASSWVSAFPRSAYAHHALASALASLGDPAALDALTRARDLAVLPDERLRVASADLSMRLAFAIRDLDTLALLGARRLADSLLRQSSLTSPRADVLRASIAALTGRAGEAAVLAATVAASDAMMIPGVLREGAPELLVLSALGGPSADVATFEQRVADRISRSIPAAQQTSRRLEILARAASMAFPEVRSIRLDSLAEGDELVAIQAAWARGDSALARAGLGSIRDHRRGVNPEVRSLDALAPEAALWLALGDARAVAEWLDPTFAVLPQVNPGPLRSPLHAASLARALIVRARAAERLGDRRAAQRYRAAIRILWSDADAALRSRVQ